MLLRLGEPLLVLGADPAHDKLVEKIKAALGDYVIAPENLPEALEAPFFLPPGLSITSATHADERDRIVQEMAKQVKYLNNVSSVDPAPITLPVTVDFSSRGSSVCKDTKAVLAAVRAELVEKAYDGDMLRLQTVTKIGDEVSKQIPELSKESASVEAALAAVAEVLEPGRNLEAPSQVLGKDLEDMVLQTKVLLGLLTDPAVFTFPIQFGDKTLGDATAVLAEGSKALAERGTRKEAAQKKLLDAAQEVLGDLSLLGLEPNATEADLALVELALLYISPCIDVQVETMVIDRVVQEVARQMKFLLGDLTISPPPVKWPITVEWGTFKRECKGVICLLRAAKKVDDDIKAKATAEEEMKKAVAAAIVEALTDLLDAPDDKEEKEQQQVAMFACTLVPPGRDISEAILNETLVKEMELQVKWLMGTDVEEGQPLPIALPVEIGGAVCTNRTEVMVAAKEAYDAQEKPEEEPWLMTTGDKVFLQIGWLFIFAFIVVAGSCVTYFNREEPVAEPYESDEFVSPIKTGWHYLLDCVYVTVSNKYSSFFIGTLAMANYVCFAFATEQMIDKKWQFLGTKVDWCKVNEILEHTSVVFFVIVTFMRISAKSRLEWDSHGLKSGLRYLFIDLFSLMEVLALIASFMDMLSEVSGKESRFNFTWIFLCRIIAQGGDTAGVAAGGSEKMRRLLTRDGKLLATSFMFGLVVWMVMSALYYDANRENNTEDATWGAAVYQYNTTEGAAPEPWVRFESIPSSMFFVLINLCKEHPLADAHKTFYQRLLAVIVCIFAMPVFGLPVAVLQQALLDARDDRQASGDATPTSSDYSPGDSMLEDATMFDTTPTGKNKLWNAIGTTFLVSLSVWSFFYYTALDTAQSTFFWIPVRMTDLAYVIIEIIISLAFLAEFCCRSLGVYFTGYKSWRDGLLIVDVLAWLPGFITVILFFVQGQKVNEWVAAFAVLRMFKLERFMHSFRDMAHITMKNRTLLTYTLVLSCLLWMFFSSVLYATEFKNPDEEMNTEVYGSILRSLWAEVINLHGEWPWADYTALGKGICTVIAIFSIMIFCVPISVFGDGFASKITDEQVEMADRLKEDPWESRFEPELMGKFRAAMYRLFYGHLLDEELPSLAFKLWRFLTISLVFFTTFITLAGSVDTSSKEYAVQHRDFVRGVWKGGYWVDLLAVIVWTLELFGRCAATGGFHFISFAGICDIVSLVGFYGSVCEPHYFLFESRTGKPPNSLEVYVLLRLLRMFSPEPYIHAVYTLKNVFKLNWYAFLRAGCGMVTAWFIFATLLYLIERPRDGTKFEKCVAIPGEEQKEQEDMSFRYKSILTSLQYAAVHLFGDYPISEYKFWSQVVHFFSIFVGIAIMSTFTGVFTASFSTYIHEQRQEELQALQWRRVEVTSRAVQRLQNIVRRIRSRPPGTPPTPRRVPNFSRLNALNIVEGRTAFGLQMRTLFQVTLVFNLVCIMIMSLPELDMVRSDTGAPAAKRLFIFFEIICTSIFAFEWLMNTLAHPPRMKIWYRSWNLFNLLCLIPGILVIMAETRNYGRLTSDLDEDYETTTEGLIMIRAIRLLNLPYFRREVHMINRALADAGPKLLEPAYLAVNVWVLSSALYMWLEEYALNVLHECSENANMQSIPETMYWTSIFLTGEWANVDFSWMGSRLCIFYVVFGIATFSMPVGIIVEAVKAELQRVTKEEQDFQVTLENLGCTSANIESKLSERRSEAFVKKEKSNFFKTRKTHFRQSIFSAVGANNSDVVVGGTPSAYPDGTHSGGVQSMRSMRDVTQAAARRLSMHGGNVVGPDAAGPHARPADRGASFDLEMREFPPEPAGASSFNQGRGLTAIAEEMETSRSRALSSQSQDRRQSGSGGSIS